MKNKHGLALPLELSVNQDGGFDICETGAGDMVADLSGCGTAQQQQSRGGYIIACVNGTDQRTKDMYEGLSDVLGSKLLECNCQDGPARDQCNGTCTYSRVVKGLSHFR